MTVASGFFLMASARDLAVARTLSSVSLQEELARLLMESPKLLMEFTVLVRWLLLTAIMSSFAGGRLSPSFDSRQSREVEKLESNPVLNLQFSSEMRDSIRSLSRGSSVGSKVVLENHSLTMMIGFRLSSEAGSRSL